jgi:spoIIIJ-associated protein
MANRALRTGRKVSLEPMNPYERRIIHYALQQTEGVDTHSEGEEPNRHVVITQKK